MLQSDNIQTFLQNVGEIMAAWVIIPDKQAESRFPNHKQFVHLSTVCDMLTDMRLRFNYGANHSQKLLRYNDDFPYNSCRKVEMTEWAREAILNRSCTESCTNCPELSKGRGRVKIECRLRDY
jgi:hypothetical protein